MESVGLRQIGAVGQGQLAARLGGRGTPLLLAEMADLAMLPVKRGDRRGHADQYAEDDEQQDHQDQGQPCHWAPKKNRRTTTPSFFTANPEEEQEQEQPEDPDKQAHARNYPDVNKKEGGLRRLRI